MKYLKINNLKVSQLVAGCMRFNNSTVADVEKFVEFALKNGVNFFDHADIYGDGKCETLFGNVLKKHPDWRKRMIIQTKCGIVKAGPTYFDFTKKHIIDSVDGSLKRLQTKYVDVLLLHRPDTLFDPDEVASAFDYLYKTKKVKYFGVSNMNSMQIELLQSKLKQKLIFNQMQFNPVRSEMITAGLFVNTKDSQGIVRDGSLLEYCRLKNITIQPWSILQASREEGTFLENKDYPELNNILEELAKKYKVAKSSIVISWICTHPANMQPICGTTKTNHLKELCEGIDIKLSHYDWYRLHQAAIKHKLP
ncbi:MAG: aldo/keto reductase [Mycoplasmataceae bacterium]|nr:aldo/keto reductase [Mycoplasmataceae bacterium]